MVLSRMVSIRKAMTFSINTIAVDDQQLGPGEVASRLRKTFFYKRASGHPLAPARIG